ncbi:MAG: DNA mismatch repair endonuclease MutL, partial [Bacteroidota bacterium]|nr:DNA mismatch repair endonuclease MutL [Bacteroidota bacterium]
AAGEVVQRPESVVKELLENSIDAGASSIRIVIKDGGKSFIQIGDDGVGMSEEDAARAFLRHATSKISSYEDLEHIRTLGFRGEALASIAAVAQVELKTRNGDDDTGTLLRVEGGEIKEKGKTGIPQGTILTVKNLFFNTPARRHFLKSNNTEFKHVYDVVQRIALSHPEIVLQLISDDDNLLDVKSSTLDERVKDLYGERFFETLVPVREETELLTISGYIGKPEFSRKSKVDQFFFLNRRYIVSRALNHAVFSGYEHLVEKGNFPFYVLLIDLDPEKIDVNVHPSKMEVKFADEQSVYRIVMAVVRKSLGMSDLIPSLNVNQNPADARSATLQHAALPRFFSPQANLSEKITGSAFTAPGQALPSPENFPFDIDKMFSAQLPVDHTLLSGLQPQPQRGFQQFAHGTREGVVIEGKAIWQLHNKYILSQIRTGLMIVDQHVAHERVLYERALTMFENSVPSSQQLLFPHTISLTPGDYALVHEILSPLQALGFELKLFGKNTIVLEGVPTDVKAGSEATILQDILDEFKNNQHRVKLEARDNVAKSFACKAAIKAGDPLTEAEMRVLIDQLFATAMPYVCPHGRPILVKVSLAELDRRFMRTS